MKNLFCMILLLSTGFVFAQGVVPEGSGTREDPYQVRSVDNLEWISSTTAAWNNHFVQICDIDATETRAWNDGAGMFPIGNSDFDFTGSYDGGGFEISSLTMNHPEEIDVAFFGWVYEATITNMALTDCLILGAANVSGLVSYAAYSEITNCMVSGEIIATNSHASGLIFETRCSIIEDCYSEATITAPGGKVGGLFFLVYDNDYTRNCYYDYETVLINDEHILHFGALPTDMYRDWKDNGLTLDIDDYLTSNGSEYLINSFDDFKTLLAFGTRESASFLLTDDLDLSDQSNFCIPQLTCDFDGGCHSVEGLNLDTMNFDVSLGLFCIASDCSISNLDITGAYIHGCNYCGVLAGLGYDLNVSDCEVEGDVICLNNGGGLCGQIEGSTFEDCRFAGNVTSTYQTGGLFGVVRTSHIYDCEACATVTGDGSIAGLVGIMIYSSSFTRCISYGEVHSYIHFAGGAFGQMGANCYFDQCFSYSNVEGIDYVGGFGGDTSAPNITNCYAHGDVEGERYVAGFIGQVLQYGSFLGEIENCYSTGFVHGDDDAGGFIGFVQACEIHNCFWDIDTSDMEISAAGTGKSTEDMKLIATYTDLDTNGLDEAWDFIGNLYDDEGTEDIWQINSWYYAGYPYFTWDNPIGVEDMQVVPPAASTIHSIYPNPFNPETTISFSVAPGQTARLEIFNIRGQRVKSFDRFKAGQHDVVWRGTDDTQRHVASGVYFCRLRTGDNTEVRKLMLLK